MYCLNAIQRSRDVKELLQSSFFSLLCVLYSKSLSSSSERSNAAVGLERIFIAD